MAKVKLTESQIQMLQKMEEQLPTKKVVKITAEQYDRIFEIQDRDQFQGITQPKPLQPATKVSKDFKTHGRTIPDSNIKFEGIEPTMDIMEFAQGIIGCLKELLIDPDGDGINEFCESVGSSKDELMEKMRGCGMISSGDLNGRKIIEVRRNRFQENIKKLYSEMVQMGDDIEMIEADENNMKTHDDVKGMMSEPFKKKHKQAMSPEMIKKKLASIRAKELERREKENNRPIGEDDENLTDLEKQNQIVGADILNHFPFTELPEDRSVGYARGVDGWGTVNLPSVNGEDSQTQMPSKKDVAGVYNWSHEYRGKTQTGQYIGWVDQFKKIYGEEPVFVLNPDAPWYGKVEVLNPKFRKRRGDYSDVKAATLKRWGTTEGEDVEETTTAASSGAFVGKLGDMPIHKGISPADAMKEGKSKKKKREKIAQMDKQQKADAEAAAKKAKKTDGMQTVQLTQKEFQDAMKHSVERNKKKYYRKNKHKGQRFNESIADEMKYSNIMHPSLGEFTIDDIEQSREDENAVSHIISLKNEKGAPSSSSLLYTYDKNTGEENVFFNRDFEKLYDAYKIFDEVYALVFDSLKEVLRGQAEIQEQGIQNSGQYATPGFPASEFMGTKGKKGKAPVNKGITHKKTMYPKGKMVKVTESQMAMIDKMIKESDAFTKTQYPDGGFVELDDCTKLNNNKEAQKGGCSVGAVDNVVKTKKTKGSVVSDDALYYEVAEKTGRSIEEVKKLIQSIKG